MAFAPKISAYLGIHEKALDTSSVWRFLALHVAMLQLKI